MVLGLKQIRRKDNKEDSRIVAIFGALGDATRFKLIQILAKNNEICVSELAQKVGISTAGASQHMKILEQAGLVNRNRMGQKICYAINKQDKDNKRLLDMILNR